MDTILLETCCIAFLAVFTLLACLAVAMKLITVCFPQRKPVVDAAVVAAISGTVAAFVPGARVTRIEEEV